MNLPFGDHVHFINVAGACHLSTSMPSSVELRGGRRCKFMMDYWQLRSASVSQKETHKLNIYYLLSLSILFYTLTEGICLLGSEISEWLKMTIFSAEAGEAGGTLDCQIALYSHILIIYDINRWLRALRCEHCQCTAETLAHQLACQKLAWPGVLWITNAT